MNDETNNSRILVIDDTRSVHDDIRKVLACDPDEGAMDELSALILNEERPRVPDGQNIEYEIDSAYQGLEGVQAVARAIDEGRPYALAFVDMRMPPGLDGVQTIEHIWSVDANVQTVICTAYSDHSWCQMVERLGRTDRLLILKKPFDSIEVCQLACALTEKWRLTQVAHLRTFELLQRRPQS